MTLKQSIQDREYEKFGEKAGPQTAVHVIATIDNESGNPVPIDGSINISAPTGPFEITVASVTATAANPLSAPLTARVSLSIRNKSASVTIYFGKNSSVTADDAATGGWEIGPGEDFNIDLNDSNTFFLIAPTGQTAMVKILEIAST